MFVMMIPELGSASFSDEINTEVVEKEIDDGCATLKLRTEDGVYKVLNALRVKKPTRVAVFETGKYLCSYIVNCGGD